MKIGIDARFLTHKIEGGVEYYGKYLLETLLKIDHENEYILYTNKDLIIKIKGRYKIKKLGLPDLLWYTPILSWCLDKDKIDVFHSLTYRIPLVPSNIRKVRLMVTIHGLQGEYFHSKNDVRFTIWWLLSSKYSCLYADHVIAVSEFLKQEIHKVYSINLSNISVIYPGIMHASKNKIKKPKYILYMGAGTIPNKNLKTILTAYSIIRKKYGIKIPFVITRVNSKEIASYGIDTTGVIPIKWAKDPKNLYKNAVISVYGSYYDAFGSPVLESMARGIPTIIANASAMPEVGDNAVVKVNNFMNPKEWAEKMYKMITNKSIMGKLQSNGLKRAKLFNWEREAKKQISVYKELAWKKY